MPCSSHTVALTAARSPTASGPGGHWGGGRARTLGAGGRPGRGRPRERRACGTRRDSGGEEQKRGLHLMGARPSRISGF